MNIRADACSALIVISAKKNAPCKFFYLAGCCIYAVLQLKSEVVNTALEQ